MTGWRPKRSQAAASSEVDVIRSMNDPMTLPRDSRPARPLPLRNDMPQRRGAKSAVVSRGLRRIRALGARPAAVFAVCFGAGTRSAIAPKWSVLTGAPRRPRSCRHGEHDDTQREHRQPHEFEYQRVHGNVPRPYRSIWKGRIERCLRLGGGPRGWWIRG